MKTILRTLLILAVALAVVGGLVFAMQSGWLSNLTGGFGRGDEPGFGEQLGVQGQPPTDNSEFRPQFNDNDGNGFRGEGGFGERGERGGGGLFGLGDVVKNLFIMGAIFVAVVAVSLGGGWLLKTFRHKQTPTTPSAGTTSA